ncbi:endonuclease III domain-containing protein [Thermotoga profunda]|uniref:endonuclease III domain-containing protein n=1 Tax=Thermotoga profunda TaxID=1508420 RepID=UPI00059740D9|nr:endonuclease III domain-containing protein [Thermotoga profunda]
MDVRQLLIEVYEILYEKYGPQGWWPADSWFEIVIGTILTQNTSWRNVEKAISNLKVNGLLEPKRLYELSNEQLAALIKPAGFFNLKAMRLKNLLDFLKEYDFDFHKLSKSITREKLLGIKGVGKETADSILLYAFNIPVFVVDNYTKRILQRLGAISQKDDYDDIQRLFNLIPPNVQIYQEYHALIVKHAKDICTKHKPNCHHCPIKNYCEYPLLLSS